MDSIDKWLKSLRLHKYTHLFKSLTYQQMLNLEEQYLIDLDITKGARNKILVSVKKLNLRQERLINMIDDLNQDTISMKEALTVLKDMLITPIPSPESDTILSNPVQHYLVNNASGSPNLTTEPATIATPIPLDPNALTNKLSPALVNNHPFDPNQLTYLFVETFEKVAHRLIESAGMEDNACHGIMAAIVDECLKHNSFTRGQKARVASFKQHFMKEQKARMASYKQQSRNNLLQQHQLQQRVAYGCGNQYNSPPSQNHSYHHQSHQFHHNNQHYPHHNSNQHYHYNHNNSSSSASLNNNSNNNNNISSSINKSSCNSSDSSNSINNHYHHQHNNHWNHTSGPIHHQPSPPSLSASLSTIGSASTSTSDEEEQRQRTYKEYSLLGPGMTFELPCLRAMVAAEKHNRRQLGFFSSIQS